MRYSISEGQAYRGVCISLHRSGYYESLLDRSKNVLNSRQRGGAPHRTNIWWVNMTQQVKSAIQVLQRALQCFGGIRVQSVWILLHRFGNQPGLNLIRCWCTSSVAAIRPSVLPAGRSLGLNLVRCVDTSLYVRSGPASLLVVRNGGRNRHSEKNVVKENRN